MNITNRVYGEEVFYIKNGSIYFDVSLIQLILTTSIVYIIIIVISRVYDRTCCKSQSYKVEFSLSNSIYKLSAVADTGNNVTDIFTGKHVIICTGIKLYRDDAYYLPIPIPYNTVSGDGIIYAIKPDSVYITDELNKSYRVDALVAGIDNECGCKRAIFNPKILNEV